MSARSSQDPAGADAPVPCPPCRGTGRLISGLGGSPQDVTCPWCEGDGVLRSDHDAQEAGTRLREAASG
ncbi:MAG: hypothetical protein U0T02_14595 [Solirubrobacteraceae bacterium]